MMQMKRNSLWALVVGLAGCTSTTLGVKYTHDSSIPDRVDIHQTDMAGPYLRFYGCLEQRPECPEIELSAEWDRHTTFGRSPIGQVEVRFPVWVKP